MEILTLNRRIFTDKSTIGDLYYRGDFFCNVLEDTCRRVKISKVTAIPSGRYRVTIEPSERFGTLMPRLKEVPNYSGILIHPGNRPEDTDGCLLVGKYNENIPDFVSSSRATFEELYKRLKAETEDIYITIMGGFPAQRGA